MLLLQGRAEMIEKYFETVSDLRARGFSVLTFDWRGQGGSDRLLADRRKGHVGDFADYEADLRAVLESELAARCAQPWFCLAHSMGACVALSVAHRGALPVKRLIAIAPMLAIHRIANPAGVLWLSRMLRRVGLGGRYIPGGGPVSIATKPYPGNPLTADAARYARNSGFASQFPDLAIGDPTIGWTRAAFTRMAEMSQSSYAGVIRTPTLVLCAGDERVVSTPAGELFASRLGEGGGVTLANARHELLMETDAVRAQVFAGFDAFVSGKAPAELASEPRS